MVDPGSLIESFNRCFEWLLITENGRTLTLQRDEIELISKGKEVLIGYLRENGYALHRIRSFTEVGGEIHLLLSGKFGRTDEAVRFVPRTTAAELAENIVAARLVRANEIAKAVLTCFPDHKIKSVSLNRDNGRLAQIILASAKSGSIALMADVTATVSCETLLAASLNWADKLSSRKHDPIDGVTLAAQRTKADELRRLCALLKAGNRERLRIVKLPAVESDDAAKVLRHFTPSELWKAKPRKITLPEGQEMTETARQVVGMSPDKIDLVRARHGETLRFHGLPFVRIRQMAGREQAWFGVERVRKPLNDGTRAEFHDLLDELMRYRDHESPSARHKFYGMASETWLESILRRNIRQLDPNLILSPIHSQFRAAAEKIDLLALRRDGRLAIIEIKTSPDRETVFQAADYWRRIEHQRRKGELAKLRLFGDMEIADRPALVYVVAPALSFHYDMERFAQMLIPEIELWRWELHENWRKEIKVIARRNYFERLV